jgi:glycosyltransferase involved in cell wall biosynthesis
MIHVAIDAHMVGQRETGNEYYTLNLIAGLTRIDPENQYALLVTDTAPLRAALRLPQNFECLRVRPTANMLRVACAMPRVCQRVGAEVLHVSYTAPPISPCSTVVTIHDISYDFFPQFFSPRVRLLLSITVPFSCRRAARIIAVSKTTKQDLVKRYGIPPEKIRVIYEAAGEHFSPSVSAEAVTRARARYAGGNRYILALGNIQPRKNLERLIEAFAALVQDETTGDGLVLVVAGQSQWRGSDVYKKVKVKGLEEIVFFPGYVPDNDLPSLYRGAEVFVFPSLYEGFGLPPLEAMACGTPVICSNTSSMPEVVGEAALLFDPYNTNALALALRNVLKDEARKQSLSAAGLNRAAQFSWEQTARKTLEVYKETASASTRYKG